MLISRVPVDVHAVEFAAQNATALIPKTDEGGFAEYLARAMENPGEQPEQYDQFSESNRSFGEPFSPEERESSPHATVPYEKPQAPNNESEHGGARAGEARSEKSSAGPVEEKEQKPTEDLIEKDSQAEIPVNAEQKSTESSKRPASGPDLESSEVPSEMSGAESRKQTQAFVVKQAAESVPTTSSEAAASINETAASDSRAVLTDKAATPRSDADFAIRVTDRSEKAVTLEVKLPDSTGQAGSEISKNPASGAAAEESLGKATKDALRAKTSDTKKPTTDAQPQQLAAKNTAATVAAVERGAADSDQRATERSERTARIEVADLRGSAKEAVPVAANGTGAEGSSSNGNGQHSDGGFSELTSGRAAATPDTGSSGISDQRTGDFAARLQGNASTAADSGNRLASSLRGGLNSEIVRQARFVIRENDSGTIRLTLKPESLGSVRIALQMQDGHIAGRIIVDNQTVRDVFEQNLAALEQAFEEAGMEMGQLDVALADSEEQSAQADTGGQGKAKRPAAGADRLAGAVPELNWIKSDHELVDVMA